MAARIQELSIGVSAVAQPDIATPNVDADFLRLTKLNAATATITPTTENDAPEIGKGNEFPTISFMTSWGGGVPIDKYMSSEFMGLLLAFALGNSVATSVGGGAVRHTAEPIDTATSPTGIEPPYLSVVEQMRPGASPIIERTLVGCMVSGFTMSIGSGPGRANSRVNAALDWSGKLIQPSGVTLPTTPLVEHLLPSASLAVTINGTDYVANKNIQTLDWQWANNPLNQDGFFPGSGFQTAGDSTSGAVRGRLEIGERKTTLKFSARKDAASVELAQLIAQTEGTAQFSLQGAVIAGDVFHDLNVSFPRVRFGTYAEGNVRGILTVDITCEALFDATLGIVTAYATNTIPLMGSET